MQANTNKRVVRNTGFLYLRMLFLMGIGFFTTRKILIALGVEDLGIFNVVGSMILMFDFVSSGLSNATQRFLNLGIGKNDIKFTRQYFSQSLMLHIIFAIIIVIFAETIGLWFVKNKLLIHADRLNAAVLILHFSVISVILKFIKICYDSDIIAREKMSVYAYSSIIEGIGKLGICYAVIYCSSVDKLVLYGFLLLLVNLVLTLYSVVYCYLNFNETHVRIYTDKKIYGHLLSFIGINSFGVISWAFGKQGINVVLNMIFGSAINGAYGLASQLDRVISQFATSIDIAVKPQITKLYAQNNISDMIYLAHKSSKYIFFIAFVISIPFLFQTNAILSIWLDEVPLYTTVFVQILVFEILFNVIGSAYNNVSMAIGKIKNIQIRGRLITLAGLPISYIVLKIWPVPYIPIIIMAVLSLIYSLYIIYDVNTNLKFGVINFVRTVAWPVVRTMITVFIGEYIINILIGNLQFYDCTILSFIFVSIVQMFFAVLVIMYLGVESVDRKIITDFIKTKLNKC